MISPMEWLNFLVAIITASVVAGGAVIGMRVKIEALREDIRDLKEEIRECRSRIDRSVNGRPQRNGNGEPD